MTTNPSSLLLIRADAGGSLATGHVQRCLSLANCWREQGGETLFVMARNIPFLEQAMRRLGIESVMIKEAMGSEQDALRTIHLSEQYPAGVMVLDGYQFNARYQKTLRQSLFPLVVIDDIAHADHYYANLIVNQNLYATEGLYPSREPETQFALGNTFALLRKEFLLQRQSVPTNVSSRVQKMLVTMGGADERNLTMRVLTALAFLPQPPAVTVITGGGYTHTSTLTAFVRRSPLHITIKNNSAAMAEEMALTDVAVSAAGTTSWELACMGVPSLLIEAAQNQHQIAVSLAEKGVSINLGSDPAPQTILKLVTAVCADQPGRQRMRDAGRELIDGKGAQRVVQLLTAL